MPKGKAIRGRQRRAPAQDRSIAQQRAPRIAHDAGMSELEYIMLAPPEAAAAAMQQRQARLAGPVAVNAAAAAADRSVAGAEEGDVKQAPVSGRAEGTDVKHALAATGRVEETDVKHGSAAAGGRGRRLGVARPLTQAEVLAFQAPTAKGPDYVGLRDRGDKFEAGAVSLPRNLQSHAAAAPQSFVGYKREAARFAMRAVADQSFRDGNHRTAVRSIYEYLRKNSLRLRREPAMLYGRLGDLWDKRQKDPTRPFADDVTNLAKYIHQLKYIKTAEESEAYMQTINAKIAKLPGLDDEMKEIMKNLSNRKYHGKSAGANTPERRAEIATLRRYLAARNQTPAKKPDEKDSSEKKKEG